MDTVGLVVILGLAALLPTDADPCGAQRPDNSTASKVGDTRASGGCPTPAISLRVLC